VCIMREQDNSSKGFGFVCFLDSQDAQKALDHYCRVESDAR
jgi:hypothetical protein